MLPGRQRRPRGPERAQSGSAVGRRVAASGLADLPSNHGSEGRLISQSAQVGPPGWLRVASRP